ncbi:hypothetical protein C0Q88_16490 [Ralstonia pickettii]|uniref:Uncharacterized protein n=1 Tax=Ralstonia pickettii TaxID=329 RepID=A0A2N4TNC8_RALPI|nr:hypothetical protein C0Q88_16490 [Ralstonia pickettii]
MFWAGECVQQPVNTPSAGKRQPAAHDLPRRQIDLQTSKTTGVLWSRYRRSAGITQIGEVPIPRTIEVMLLAWTHLATAAAVMTMAMTRVGTRKSGMLEGPVLNA